MLSYTGCHGNTKYTVLLGEAAEEFVGELGRRLCKTMGEPCSREYLLQRILIAMQRGNAAAVLGTMGKPQLDSWE